MDWYFHLGLVFPFPGIKVDILRGAVTLGPYYPLRFWGKGSGRSAPPTASVRGDSSHSTNASTTVQSSLSPPATASISILRYWMERKHSSASLGGGEGRSILIEHIQIAVIHVKTKRTEPSKPFAFPLKHETESIISLEKNQEQ